MTPMNSGRGVMEKCLVREMTKGNQFQEGNGGRQTDWINPQGLIVCIPKYLGKWPLGGQSVSFGSVPTNFRVVNRPEKTGNYGAVSLASVMEIRQSPIGTEIFVGLGQ